MTVKVTELENGLRVVTAHMPHVQTVTLGVWVGVGSRHEPKSLNGITHFIEHMLFKGTKRRSAREISEQVENVGGILNAYTARERTAYHVKVLYEDVPLALDIIADMLQNSEISDEELTREADVVIQEIGQSHDTPDDIIFDYLFEKAYDDQPLGRSILGPAETVASLQRQQLKDYIAEYYSTANMVVAAAGHIDHAEFVAQVSDQFKNMPISKEIATEEASWKGGSQTYERDLEQLHFLLAFPTCNVFEEDYYAYEVLAILMGGGMSSRLFQEVREEKGLAYSIYNFHDAFEDTGMMVTYAGADPERLQDLVSAIVSCYAQARQKITEEEFKRAKAQIRSGLRMVLESTSARCELIASQLLRYGRVIPLSEIEEKLDHVTLDDLHQVLDKMLTQRPALVTLGPKGYSVSEEKIKELLATH